MNISTTTNTQQDNRTSGFTQTTMDRFAYYLRYDIQLYIDFYNFFIKNNKQQILDFYMISSENPDYQSFKFLDLLLAQSEIIENLIKLGRNYFRRVDDWELLEFIEDIKINLLTIQNSPKFTRSSKTINTWVGQSISKKYTLKQKQTIEQVSAIVNNPATSQNDWMAIALQNDLDERDYTTGGGNVLQVAQNFINNIKAINATSIVDSLQGETLYGLDFDKKLTFDADGDLSVLNYKSTFIQSVVILIGLKKGDVPELPTFGLDPDLSAGSDAATLLGSSINRQLQQVFASDDSIKNFSLTGISYQNRAIYITFLADSLYNLTYGDTQNISKQ